MNKFSYFILLPPIISDDRPAGRQKSEFMSLQDNRDIRLFVTYNMGAWAAMLTLHNLCHTNSQSLNHSEKSTARKMEEIVKKRLKFGLLLFEKQLVMTPNQDEWRRMHLLTARITIQYQCSVLLTIAHLYVFLNFMAFFPLIMIHQVRCVFRFFDKNVIYCGVCIIAKWLSSMCGWNEQWTHMGHVQKQYMSVREMNISHADPIVWTPRKLCVNNKWLCGLVDDDVSQNFVVVRIWGVNTIRISSDWSLWIFNVIEMENPRNCYQQR